MTAATGEATADAQAAEQRSAATERQVQRCCDFTLSTSAMVKKDPSELCGSVLVPDARSLLFDAATTSI